MWEVTSSDSAHIVHRLQSQAFPAVRDTWFVLHYLSPFSDLLNSIVKYVFGPLACFV